MTGCGAVVAGEEGKAQAVMVTVIIFIFRYLLAALRGVHTDLFGGLFARLFVVVLSIINGLIQAHGGDIKCRCEEVVKAPAAGETTGNFNEQCGPRGATVYRVNAFFLSVLTATTAARITTVARIDDIFTGALIPDAAGSGIEFFNVFNTLSTLFNEINENKMIFGILKNETGVLRTLLAADFVSLFSQALAASCTNINGCFLVTHRILDMFKRPQLWCIFICT